MRLMEHIHAGGCSEPFLNESEYPVCYHIYRINCAFSFPVQDLPSQSDQHYNIEYNLYLSGRILKLCPRYQPACAASADNTVNPCTHKCEQQTYGKYIEHLRRLLLCNCRNKEISCRHKCHRTKQAHAACAVHIKSCFDYGKHFNRKYTV